MSTQNPQPRTRESASAVEEQYEFHEGYKSWTGTSSTSGFHPPYVHTKTTDDYVTPNFTKRKSRGEIIMNPFSSRTTEIKDPIVSGMVQFTRSDGYIPYKLDGTFTASRFTGTHDFLSMTYVDPQIIAEQAVTKAYANMASSPFQSLVSLAEAKKTYNTVQSVFSQARDLLIGGLKLRRKLLSGKSLSSEMKRAIRRNGGSFQSINKVSKSAGNAYLQYRYGLRPLAYELQGLAKALEDRKPRYTFTGYADYSSGRDEEPWDAYRNDYLVFTRQRSVSHEISAVAKLLVEPKSSSVMSTMFDPFGIDNYFQTGWELIPFSFVVDWFLNIGDIVASFEPVTDYNVLSSCVTVRETKKWTHECKNFALGRYAGSLRDTNNLTYVRQCNVPALRYQKIEKHQYRTPSPRRTVIPSLDINLDVAKLTDILALVRQFYA